MKTPAISSTAHPAIGAPAANKPSDMPFDTSFGQMLSRELATRPDAARAAAQPDTARPNTARAEGAPKAAGSGKPGAPNAPRPARAENRRAEAPDDAGGKEKPAASADAHAAGSSSIDGAAKADAANADEDSGEIVSAASAELLALVASLTQPAVGRSETAQAEDTEKTGADADQTHTAAQPALLSLGAQQSDALRAEATAQMVDATGALLLRNQSGHAATMQQLFAAGARGDAQAGQSGSGLKEADLRPMSIQDAKTAAIQDGAAIGAAVPEDTGFAALRAAAETAAARSPQELQAAAPAPLNPAALSPAALQAAQSAPGTRTDLLAPRVGTPGWDQALAQKVVWMVGGDQQSASLTLNPPDLGPLQVVLSVSDSQATANFMAAQPEVRQALEAALPKLRDMLGEAGIQLGQANVSAGTPDNPQNGFGQPQQPGARHATPQQDDGHEPQARASRVVATGQGLVDTFA